MLLLAPILLPLVGGIFVFRQKTESVRNRLTLTLVAATALLALAVCWMPQQSLELLTIQGELRMALCSDQLAKFFMVLVACIWAPVLVFSFPYIRHAGGEQSFLGFYTMALGILMGLALSAPP